MPAQSVASSDATVTTASRDATVASSDATAREAYVNLARSEFYNQRMHRTPVPPPVLAVQSTFDTCHAQSYRPRPPQKVPVPEFTVGRKNAVGTSNVYSKVSLDELRHGQLQLDSGGSSSWMTTSGGAFVPPNQRERFQGSAAVRGGIAPRMPYSEVERRFATVDSAGTMPGGSSHAQRGRSEQQERFANPGPQPLREPEFTLRYLNDIGSGTRAATVPPTMLNATHFELGISTENRFVTSSGAAHGRKTPVARGGAAGMRPPASHSEVERVFHNPLGSREYNIVSTGERLGGPLNVEAARQARSSCGRKQHPSVGPALRGPTGTRQTYDIVSGLDRPKERWCHKYGT